MAADSPAGQSALGPEPNTASSQWHFRFPPRYRVIWLALAGLLAVVLITAPGALSSNSIRIQTPLLAVLAVVALGQYLVVMSGGFDLSVPAIMSFSSALLLEVTGGSNDKILVGVVLVLAAAFTIGAVNGLLAGPAGLNPLIVTLAMGGLVAAGALIITDSGASVLNTGVPAQLSDFATGYVGSVSNLLIAAAVVVGVFAVVMKRTVLGRRAVAAGSNPLAARIAGIRVNRFQIGSYAVAGLLYGIGGLMLAAFVERPNLNLGDPYLLTTFIVVALGGVTFAGGPASVLSTVAGAAFLILLLHYLSVEGLSAGIQSLVQGVVLVAAVAVVTALGGSRGRSNPRTARLMTWLRDHGSNR